MIGDLHRLCILHIFSNDLLALQYKANPQHLNTPMLWNHYHWNYCFIKYATWAQLRRCLKQSSHLTKSRMLIEDTKSPLICVWVKGVRVLWWTGVQFWVQFCLSPLGSIGITMAFDFAPLGGGKQSTFISSSSVFVHSRKARLFWPGWEYPDTQDSIIH